MINEKFYDSTGPLSVDHVCGILNIPIPSGTGKQLIHHIATVHQATPKDIVLVLRKEFVAKLKETKAGFVLTTSQFQEFVPKTAVALITPYPHRDFGKIIAALYKAKQSKDFFAIHPSAIISKTAKIGKNVSIGANTVIEDDVIIEDDVHIGHHCTVGIACSIAHHTTIEDNVHIRFAVIGEYCTIRSMVTIGVEGFGFSIETDEHITFPQIGQVIIQDHVLISSGVQIDRGQGLDDTIIESYVAIDHTTLITHNCHIGHHTVLSSMVILGGSIHIGHHTIIGGLSVLKDQISIGNNVLIYPVSAVGLNVPDNVKIAGIPALPQKEYIKNVVNSMSKLKQYFYKNEKNHESKTSDC